MTLSELTSRDAVLAAIKEFDGLGREAFLKKHGFGPARQFFIEHGSQRYDSKAIAGVAYGYQFPDRGPLKPSEFSGGEETVGHVLEQLGFKVSDGLSIGTPQATIAPAASSLGQPRAWVFQANPTLYDLQGALRALTDLTWLVKQHKNDIKEGDTVYLWEGGSGAGIVAVAKVTAGPALRGENEQETNFNRDATKFAGEQLRVLLRVERVLEKRINRADLQAHPILRNMTILKAPQGTNFALGVDEGRALNALIPRGTMALTLADLEAMMAGFAKAGFQCNQRPASRRNPVVVEWHTGDNVQHYRLWAFDVTHGGGGPAVRAADEFRIQITNGPSSLAEIDKDGITDLLVGYSRDRDSIIAYDRRWLEWWIEKTSGGERGSPSVQVKEADIQAGHDRGLHHLTKTAGFGEADIVTMSPTMLPAYLLNHEAVLHGTMTAEQAQSACPNLGGSNVVDYCRSQGFPFEADLLARYIASLLTKPFIILAGISGTGKSKLPELVAEYYGATATSGLASLGRSALGDKFVLSPAKGAADPKRFALVAVRPDWIDNQSILGFVNPITESYESTQALDLILRANQALTAASDKPAAPRYFMLLDEMNLARVEHYFSDWLSCAESRRLRPDGSIVQQSVPLHRSKKPMEAQLSNPDGSTVTVSVSAMLSLPTNLVVTGTVNVDETTFGFSPKVLDRAMVIEFDEVDLDQLRAGIAGSVATDYHFPETLPPFRLATAKDFARLPSATHNHLVTINGILQEARLHLGYRAANEAALFMMMYNEILPEQPADTDWLRALDTAVLQKVLPRLSGNRAKLEGPLAKLCSYLRDLQLPAGDVSLEEFDSTAKSALPKSYRRAIEMLEALRGFGFVSFFK
jgi:EVE domain